MTPIEAKAEELEWALNEGADGEAEELYAELEQMMMEEDEQWNG